MKICKKPRRWNVIDMDIPSRLGINRRVALKVMRSGVDLSDENAIRNWLSKIKERWSVSLKDSNRWRESKDRNIQTLKQCHRDGLSMKTACEAHAIRYQAAKNYSREIGLRWGRSRKSVQSKSSPTIDKIRTIPMQLMLRKGTSVHPLCGISGVKLREWIESKFSKSMTWENYGKRWHLDHIFPISRFDLSDPEQVKVACNWQNLQPLLRRANARKSNKITNPQLSLALVTA